MSERTLTINHADGNSETYTLTGVGSEPFEDVRRMMVDGEIISVDRTEAPKIRELLLDGQTIVIDRSKGDAERTLTVDGQTVTVSRPDEINSLDDYVLGLLSFNESSSQVIDGSLNRSDAILNSGRGVAFDGVNDSATMPVVSSEPIAAVSLMAKSATDTEVFTSLGSATIEANDTWQKVSFETPAKNYGDYQWFNGVDTSVEFNGTSATNIGVKRFSIKGRLGGTYSGSDLGVFSKGVSGSGLIEMRSLGDSECRFIWRRASNNYHWSFPFQWDGTVRSLELYFDPINDSAPTVLVDGSSVAVTPIVGSYSFDPSFDDSGYAFILGSRGGGFDPFRGIIANVVLKVNDTTMVDANGNTPWADMSGNGNDGTPSGSFQTVTEAFTPSPSLDVTLGSNGSSYFSGAIADVTPKDASGNVIDQAYLNEHTDTNSNGLNGLPLITRKGQIGSYNGCNAVIQQGGAAGLFPPQVLGMNFNRYASISPAPIQDDDGDILVPESFSAGIDALGGSINPTRSGNTFNADGSGYAIIEDISNINITTEATWIFRGNFNGPTPLVSESILAKWGLSSGTRSFLFVLNSGNPQPNELRISLSSNGTAVHRQDFQTLDEDSLWVVRYDGPNGVLNVQRDGTLLTSQSTAGGFPSSLRSNGEPLVVGANGTVGSLINISKRRVSDIKIHDRYLTDAEVSEIYS